jgi:hypothetical protein
MYRKEKSYQTEDSANPGQSRRNYLRRKEENKENRKSKTPALNQPLVSNPAPSSKASNSAQSPITSAH